MWFRYVSDTSQGALRVFPALSETPEVRKEKHKDLKFVVDKNGKDLDSLRQTFKPQTSSVLGRVRDFLPKLAAANEDIQRQLEEDPESVSVENVQEGQTHVEMNIALVEQSSDSDYSDTSDSDEDIPIGEVTEDNLRLSKPTKRSNKVLIESCTETDGNEISNLDQASQDGSIGTTIENT